MNVNDLFPSRFLKAHDLGGKAFTLTIRDITLESVGHGAEQEQKLTLAFEKATKMMLLNRTNAMIIASMYGPETDAWKGKAVIVYPARVKAFGAWHDALRIKEQIPPRNVGAERMTDAMTEQPPIDDEDDLLDVDEGDAPRTVDPATGEILDDAEPSDGDSLFTPQKPPDAAQGKQATPTPQSPQEAAVQATEDAPKLSEAQHKNLHAVGRTLYGSEWDEQRPKLVQAVSKGVISSSNDLTPEEADKLIAGITKKINEVEESKMKRAAA